MITRKYHVLSMWNLNISLSEREKGVSPKKGIHTHLVAKTDTLDKRKYYTQKNNIYGQKMRAYKNCFFILNRGKTKTCDWLRFLLSRFSWMPTVHAPLLRVSFRTNYWRWWWVSTSHDGKGLRDIRLTGAVNDTIANFDASYTHLQRADHLEVVLSKSTHLLLRCSLSCLGCTCSRTTSRSSSLHLSIDTSSDIPRSWMANRSPKRDPIPRGSRSCDTYLWFWNHVSSSYESLGGSTWPLFAH